jgi:uncharacterized membrane protein YeaQ/YmgE (transglycosylase-associated protein family)
VSAKSRFVGLETAPIAIGIVGALMLTWLISDWNPWPVAVVLGAVATVARAVAAAHAFENMN